MRKIFFLFLLIVFSKANSNEVIKQIIFKTNELQNCGKANVNYQLYSNSKYNMWWHCLGTDLIDKYNGSWEYLIENGNLTNHVITISNHAGTEYQDIIKITDNSLSVSWNGGDFINYEIIKIKDTPIKDLEEFEPASQETEDMLLNLENESNLSVEPLKAIPEKPVSCKEKIKICQKSLDEKENELLSKDQNREKLVKFYVDKIEKLNLKIQSLEATIVTLSKKISNQSSLNVDDNSHSSNESNENLKYGDTGFVLVNGKKWSIPDFSLEFPEDHQRKRLQVYGYIPYYTERNYGSPEYQFHLRVNEGKLCSEVSRRVCSSNDDWVIVIATTDNKITPNKAKQESKQWKKKLIEVEDKQYLVKMSGTVSFWSDSRKITMIVDRIDKIDKKPE